MTERLAGGSTTRCRACHKPILWPGLCYTCATGLPRLLRPPQRASRDAPAGDGSTPEQAAGAS